MGPRCGANTTGTRRASAGFARDPKRKEVAAADPAAGNFLCRFGGNPLTHRRRGRA